MRGTLLALALAAAGCGGGGAAKVKGTLTENGSPPGFLAAGQAAVILRPVGADGRPEPNRSYPMMLDREGKFELVAAGGSVPAGTYQLTLDLPGTGAAKYKSFAATRELKSGDNDLTVDVSKPDG